MTITCETFKLGEYTQNAPFTPFRVVSDSSTRTVWYLGDEGQIIPNVLESDLWDKYTTTGHLVLMGASADELTEADLFDKMADIDHSDEEDKLWAIILYLGGTAVSDKMWRNYEKGLCTLCEAISHILAQK